MTHTPENISTLTSALFVEDAQRFIDIYQKAFDAEVCGVLHCPKTGKIAHACLKIGDSSLFIQDAIPEMNMPATGQQHFYLYVENVDRAFDKAREGGLEEVQKPEDAFWGDRVGILKDRHGNTWKLAQRLREVSPEELEDAMKKMAEAA